MRQPVRGGVAATEFALVLPLLITVILGCVDFGRFASAYVAVTNAARVGASRGGRSPWTSATAGVWQAQIQQAIEEELSPQDGFDHGLVSITVTPLTSGGSVVAAQVQVSYPFTTLVSWPGVPSSLTLNQVAVMPCIRP